MLRTLILLIGVSSVGLFLDSEPVQARKWSPGNPGIYSNIHGVNYRSMRYERDYRNRRPSYRSRRGLFFRRR